MIVIKILFHFTFKAPKKQVDIPKPEGWKINQERMLGFYTVLLYCRLAMPRLALIITDPSLLFRSSQLLLLPWKPLIWIGMKPALIADPNHQQAHHSSNSVCSLQFVKWFLCFAWIEPESHTSPTCPPWWSHHRWTSHRALMFPLPWGEACVWPASVQRVALSLSL